MSKRNGDAWKARGQYGSSSGGHAGRSGPNHGGGKDKGCGLAALVLLAGAGSILTAVAYAGVRIVEALS